ncbi:exo-beta-N-acetylmuramidase NamZ domain-containing protein [Sutcliffiella horikoshii]|uniref:exo-beta-N-acetylmuramidase NamZ family protein n=1 Tax=Sutcliffiella horikoshii TaxID=79883 RepID=UPI00384DA73C
MAKILYGIDRFVDGKPGMWSGKRIGIVTNQTGVTSDFRSTIDVLKEMEGVSLHKLFACEHGVRGDVQAGVHVEDFIDEKTGLPVFSLYGPSKKVSTELLEDVDAIFFDIQDVGVRFYTYLATVKYIMEACQQTGTAFVVMDRPNPIAPLTSGNILESEFVSFVGPYSLPVCLGLTIGEYARLIQKELYPEVDLHVYGVKNWDRSMWGDQWQQNWIPPSPNIPHFSTTLYYPITCFIEGTNLSEGRGTTKPFEWIGAPWFKPEEMIKHFADKNVEGVELIPAYFTPNMSKHVGDLCKGVQLLVTNRHSLQISHVAYELLHSIFSVHEEAEWLAPFKEGMHPFTDLLWGTEKVRMAIDSRLPYAVAADSWDKGLDDWQKRIDSILLYN